MSRESGPFAIRELLSVRDPAWEAWKRIYHDSFPEHERMTEGFFRRKLACKEARAAPEFHLLILAPGEAPDRVTGIACYETDPEQRAGLLWYLAIRREDRGRGLGTLFYADLVRRLRAEGVDLLLFEVEVPERAEEESPEAASLARRRIAWYQRQGALLLGGVEYWQSVDAPVEPVEMHLMAHPLGVPITPEEAFARASAMFDEALRQTGPLCLESTGGRPA